MGWIVSAGRWSLILQPTGPGLFTWKLSRVLRVRAEVCKASLGLYSELAQYHLFSTLLVKPSHNTSPNLSCREMDSTFWCEELQSHIRKGCDPRRYGEFYFWNWSQHPSSLPSFLVQWNRCPFFHPSKINPSTCALYAHFSHPLTLLREDIILISLSFPFPVWNGAIRQKEDSGFIYRIFPWEIIIMDGFVLYVFEFPDTSLFICKHENDFLAKYGCLVLLNIFLLFKNNQE